MPPQKFAKPRTVLMCQPDFFTVDYRINPWMHPENPTDTTLALAQWNHLYDIYTELGHTIHLIDPVEGLPDMVYSANGGFVLDGTAYGAKFRYHQRQPEGPAYEKWFVDFGFQVHTAEQTNEGEGDFLLVGDTIYAATGFRSDASSHDELRHVFGREVVSLTLTDPRFYHFDTAFSVLDSDGGPGSIAYLPQAFDERSLVVLHERFPDAIQISETDAEFLGANCFSDGRNVVVAAQVTAFADQLRARGYVPHAVDLSELLLGGGGVKCCTLELRS